MSADASMLAWINASETVQSVPALLDKNSRVAVCMVGAVRTLVMPGVHSSIRRYLLDAQLLPTDLFLHLHLGWDHSNFAPGMGHHGAAGRAQTRDSPALLRAIEALKPVETKLTEDSGCGNPEMASHPVCVAFNSQRPVRRGATAAAAGHAGRFALRSQKDAKSAGSDRGGRYLQRAAKLFGAGAGFPRLAVGRRLGRRSLRKPPSAGELAGFLQYMWVQRCQESALAREKASRGGLQYAWLIRTRPDLAFFDNAPPAIAYPPRRLVLMAKESRPAYFDGFWMVPRPLLAEHTAALGDFWSTLDSLPWPPEWSFFPWLKRSARLPWAYAPVPAVLVRGGGQADCWRLQRRETAEAIYDMQEASWGRQPGQRDSGMPQRVLSFAEACRAFAGSLGSPKAVGLCRGWVQTLNCDPDGQQDFAMTTTSCVQTINRGASGYCRCMKRNGGEERKKFTCQHKPIRCDIQCGGGGPHPAIDGPDGSLLSDRATVSYLRPGADLLSRAAANDDELASNATASGAACTNGTWEKVHRNVPHPLSASRCNVRFKTLRAARKACCAAGACQAVVRDNGMPCDTDGLPLTFELRHGVREVRAALAEKRARKRAGGAMPGESLRRG